MTHVSPDVSVSFRVQDNVKMRTVELRPGSLIRIADAHEIDAIRSYPITLGWKWSGINKESQRTFLEILLIDESSDFSHTLFCTEVRQDEFWHDILLQWPPAVGIIKKFSIVISCRSADSKPNAPFLRKWSSRLVPDRITKHKELAHESVAIIGISRSFDSRCFIQELIKGTGIEVGPGLNPHILPSEKIRVRYIETMTGEEWVKLYKKNPSAETLHGWNHYILGNAMRLDNVADESLDFIFSNHVFEHLMNPIGVLENWSRKLTRNGIIYSVIPDAHSCFDLRQPLSDPAEWISEHRQEQWQPDMQKYGRWCAYTAPYNTPADLIERKYSIHVHYYSPESAARLATIVIGRGLFSGYFIAHTLNHKDFALILFKERRYAS